MHNNQRNYAIMTGKLSVNSGMHDAVFFHKPDEPNGFFSNWWLSGFELDGIEFSSVEQ